MMSAGTNVSFVASPKPQTKANASASPIRRCAVP